MQACCSINGKRCCGKERRETLERRGQGRAIGADELRVSRRSDTALGSLR